MPRFVFDSRLPQQDWRCAHAGCTFVSSDFNEVLLHERSAHHVPLVHAKVQEAVARARRAQSCADPNFQQIQRMRSASYQRERKAAPAPHHPQCVCAPCARSKTFTPAADSSWLGGVAATIGVGNECVWCKKQRDQHFLVLGSSGTSERYCYQEGLRYNLGIIAARKIAEVIHR